MINQEHRELYPDPNREIYPNSKLINVSFEIRFYPLLEIDLEIVQFQKKIREELPIYKIDKTLKRDNDTKLLVEQNVHSFKSEEGNISLNITTNNLSLQNKNYPRFESFRERVLKYTNIFLSKFDSIKQLGFLGLRYINEYELSTDDFKLEDVVEFFNTGLDRKEILKKKIEDFQLSQIYYIDKSRQKRFFGLTKDTKYKLYAIRLDIDSNFTDIKMPIQEWEENLNLLHKNLKISFQNSITEEFKKKFLRKREDLNGE